MGTLLDVLLVAVVAVASGHAGFYARGLWDDYRMRRMLVRINRDLTP